MNFIGNGTARVGAFIRRFFPLVLIVLLLPVSCAQLGLEVQGDGDSDITAFLAGALAGAGSSGSAACNIRAGAGDAESVAFDKTWISIGFADSESANGIKNNITLPTTGCAGSTIAWSTSNATHLDANGNVTRPNTATGNQEVTLTATISKGSESDTQDILIIVLEHRPFITVWKTDNQGVSSDTSVTIPVYPGEVYNYTVNWGDGTIETGITGSASHAYATIGLHEVKISGTFPGINFNNASFTTSDILKITQLTHWGELEWKRMDSAFYGASNMAVTATDAPDLTRVTSLENMFRSASAVSMAGIDLSGWDVSGITNMSNLFNSTSFQGDVGNWNVGQVVNMAGLFQGTSFNGDISNWNTGQVTDMSDMFNTNGSFNGDISRWDVSKVTNMNSMFSGASVFNGDITSWNVGNVVNMATMFSFASAFSNHDLSGWDVSKVTDHTNFMAPLTGPGNTEPIWP